MAGSMKDIKLRIKSVESTMQITKAMELVASSKMRRAKERVEHSRPYFETLHDTLTGIAAADPRARSPYLRRAEIKRTLLVVIAGDRGLAGGYNSNVLKQAEAQQGPVTVLPIGKRSQEYFAHHGADLFTEEVLLAADVSVGECFALSRKITEGYLKGDYDAVKLSHTRFDSMMTQTAVTMEVLPLTIEPTEEQKAAEVGLCDVNQTVSITENFDGKTIDHLKTLPASVKFITEDGHGVQDNATMARAFAICTQRDITVMSHAEDMEISPWDYRLAEDIETVRNCWLSEYYQTRLHMCHVSTRGAIEAIQMAKLRGAPVTCEVTPHHLWFTDDTCDYRVNPPIRTADDVQALIDAIRSGVVDAIATDHAPHSEEDKLKGMAGMVGSETAFGVCYTKLCKEEGLPLELLSHLMSTRPAEILGLAKGQLEPGYDADFVLVDLDTPYTVDKNKLHSKSHNCPFDGAQLYGRVCATVKGGELTYQAEE